MNDMGEHLVGLYFEFVERCDFVQYNLNTNVIGIQGEIDVAAVNTKDKKVYICEVATHLSGMRYNRKEDNKTIVDNVDRFIKKIA